METGYFRYASNSEKKDRVYTTVLGSLFITSTLFIILALVWSGPISALIGYEEHKEYIKWLAVIVGIDAFTSIPFARIRLRNQPLKYGLIRIGEVSINIGLNLFFLYYCPRHSDSELVSLLYNENIGLLLIPDILAALRSVFDRSLFKQILRYSYPLLIAGLAGTVNEALDRILLKHMIPLEQNPMEQLGIYGANYKLAVLMTLFVQMFKYAAEPFFFSKSGEKNAQKLYADVMMFFVVAGLFIFLLVNLYLDYFILFIGADFREGVHIVPVVLLANLVMGIFFNLSIWYKLTNKTHIGAVLVLLGALITVFVNVLFIPRYGYVASAWAHLICYSTMVIVSYLWSRKHYAIPYRSGRILAYILVAIVIYLSNELFLQNVKGSGNLCGAIVVLGERRTFNQYKSS
jgi:O-antigen/teichoic acid export membrane protein